jgi:hypothetical protein
MSFDTMNTILLRLANGHQRTTREQGIAQLGVSCSHQTGRASPLGLKTQSAALTARHSGALPAHVVHGRHKQAAGIRRHP